MKKIIKVLAILIAFVVCYLGIMVFAINYLYPYPNYKLDEWERADNARYYRIVYQEKIDSNTLVYFSRSNNGVGGTLHFGTVDSSAPHLNKYLSLANFFCQSTSSAYVPVDTLNYIITSDSSHTCILYGSTLNENTTKVSVRFYTSKTDYTDIDLNYCDQCYYLKDFDVQYANYDYTLYYLNDDDNIVLRFDCKAMNSTATLFSVLNKIDFRHYTVQY